MYRNENFKEIDPLQSQDDFIDQNFDPYNIEPGQCTELQFAFHQLPPIEPKFQQSLKFHSEDNSKNISYILFQENQTLNTQISKKTENSVSDQHPTEQDNFQGSNQDIEQSSLQVLLKKQLVACSDLKTDINKVKQILAQLYRCNSSQGDAFSQLYNYFELNVLPIQEGLNKAKSLMKQFTRLNEESINEIVQPLLKPKFYDQIQKEVELQVSISTDPLQQQQSKMTLMQLSNDNIQRGTQFDGLLYKFKIIEQKLLNVYNEVKLRPRIDIIDSIKEQQESFKQQVFQQMKLLVEKSYFNTFSEKTIQRLDDLESVILNKIGRQDYIVDVDQRIKLIDKRFEKINAELSEKTDKDFQKKQFMELMEYQEFTQKNLLQFKIQTEQRHEELCIGVKQSAKTFDEKITRQEFLEFKDYSNGFLHKKDVEEFYNNVLPNLDLMKQQVKEFSTQILSFTKFIKKTDIDILHKASKMDFEILYKSMSEKQFHLREHTQDIIDIKHQISSIRLYVSSFYEDISNQIRQEVSSNIIMLQIGPDIQQTVEQKLKELDFYSITDTLNECVKSLNGKANKQDLIEIFENKSSKISVEAILKIQITQWSNMKNILGFIQKFIELSSSSSDSDTPQYKRQETYRILQEILLFVNNIEKYQKTNFLNLITQEPQDNNKFSKRYGNIVKIKNNQKVFSYNDYDTLLQEQSIQEQDQQKSTRTKLQLGATLNARIQLRPLFVLQRESVLQEDDNPGLSPTIPRQEIRSKSHNQNEYSIVQTESRKLHKQ